MDVSNLRIELKSNPQSPCKAGDHFVENWINATSLHPLMRKVRYFTDFKSDVDLLQLKDSDGNIRLELRDSEALRLDLLSNELFKLLG